MTKLGECDPEQGQLLLIGWSLRRAATDSGVSAVVKHVLTHAMTAVAEVSYFSAGALARGSGTRVEAIAPQGFTERVAAATRRFPANTTLVSTLDGTVAQELFDAPQFPWELQGQIALLSLPAAPGLRLSFGHARALFERDWCNGVRALADQGVVGALRPGVDGDVAALFALSNDFVAAFRRSLAQEATRAGIAVEECTEDDFAQRIGGETSA